MFARSSSRLDRLKRGAPSGPAAACRPKRAGLTVFAVLVGLCIVARPLSASEPSAITADELRTHVATLAADSFEGREAGTRGGHAAAAYLLSELKSLDVQPAGDDGSAVQMFGNDYRNVLVAIPGSDEQLRREVVVVGAHFDHVGYGAQGNSFGPIGQIHNGADDNASGTAALLELVEALASAGERPRRTLLFAFWDAEEKGLLGSEHWMEHPTVSRESICFAFNFDMLGRLRNRTVEVYGVRTSAGLRHLLGESNAATDLVLKFDWSQREDSDHFTFFKRDIPYLMLHTGLHDEYHRPVDDAHLVDIAGLQAVTELSHAMILAVADAPAWEFRHESRGESNETRRGLSTPAPQPAPRFGVRWDAAHGERGVFVLTDVEPQSAADVAGLRVGDRIISLNGSHPPDSFALRKAVLAAPAESQLVARRGEQEATLPIRFAGTAVRVGFSWRLDDAEPGIIIVNGVVSGSAADEAGLRVGDRIYAVNGERFSDESTFRRAFRRAGTSPELSVERSGRLWKTRLALPARSSPTGS